MYELHALPAQNMTDGWALMYASIARSLMDTVGRSGEGVIREAARRYGRALGKARQEEHLRHKVKTNLVSLYGPEDFIMDDPRFRKCVQHLDEESYLLDVVTCPLADMWIAEGEKHLGRFFCEEFYHALNHAYCYGKDQPNLSKSLTHDGDNHCRLAMYMRAANLPAELRPQSYARFAPDAPGTAPNAVPAKTVAERQTWRWLAMYYAFMDAAADKFGDEGRCAVSLGLRKLGVRAAEYMKLRADMTGNKPDKAYVTANHPIGFDVAEHPFWQTHDQHDARRVLLNDFLRIFKANLTID